MTDRLTDAFNMLRQGGATHAGRVRLTNYGDTPRSGMTVAFRLDVAAKDCPDENPHVNPFKGMHCSPKDGDEFLLLVIPVANGPAEPEPAPIGDDSLERRHAVAEPPADRRRITDLPYSQRAAMLCREELFWRYAQVRNADAAAAWLRHHCNVKSRKDLDSDHDAALRFERLRKDFYAWTQEPADRP